MKIVVFAHVPPPHHGQSFMVKMMLDGLRSGRFGDFEIHHVDARFSDNMEDIGGSGLHKIVRAVKFAAQAIAARFKHGARTLYYIPAPPKTNAMIRDWIVMVLCRPFFPRLVLHWHAVGLGDWTTRSLQSGGLKDRLAARLNRLFLGRHTRSIVLTDWARADIAVFSPREVRVVGNGIADPCPDFGKTLLPARQARLAQLRPSLEPGAAPDEFTVAFLGHCTDAKGLLDAMEATAEANQTLQRRGLTLRIRLRIAGEFPSAGDRQRYEEKRAMLQQQFGLPEHWIEHVGFVGGADKRRFLEQADCLCFPTRYEAESFGLVAVEALAFGIPPVTSDWRMLPELMKAVGLPVAKAGDARDLADQLIAAIGRDDPARLRDAYLSRFAEEAHLRSLAAALKDAENPR